MRFGLIFFSIGCCPFLLNAQTDSLKGNQRFSIHAQTTIIDQYKPGYSARYSGKNSLSTHKENQISITTTLYLGARLWKGASIFVNGELAGGSGLSGALGIADATNGETFRIGNPAPQIYLARAYFRQMFALNKNKKYQDPDFNQLGMYEPTRYISITIGKIGIADYFDDNKFSHDPRTQFMSWGLMANGAWDYPANTRGYTPSIVLEYVTPVHEFRLAASLVPLTSNGPTMNWNISQAGAYTAEYTFRHYIKKQKGAIRILAFLNTTNMGNYAQSMFESPLNPVIENTRRFGRIKYGFGINAEQNITDDIGVFLRASWNDGRNETWAFTEIDHSASLGFSMQGTRWKRTSDNIGLAYVVSGISKQHQNYLEAGGTGFIIGDGNLRYGLEHVLETYYSTELYKKHLYLTGAYQLVVNPAYNLDRRGPVNVFSLRLHARI